MTTSTTPTLCLNMIVKNESRIIRRLLDSVSDIIDGYCICDTGSSDDTINIIETYFREKNIPGKVIKEAFRNFEYNRSFALKACEEIDCSHILLLDADMIFWRNPKIDPPKLKQLLTSNDAFYIFQGNENMYYKNTRIVKNNAGVHYKGVTHEYVNLPENTTQGVLVKDIVFIRDIGDGGAKADKFQRDIRLLKGGLEKDPSNERYLFYLGNSLKDLAHTQNRQIEDKITQLQSCASELTTLFQNHTPATGLIKNIDVMRNNLKKEQDVVHRKLLYEAIDNYDKRIKAGGFWEEVWYSHYNIGHAYFHLGEIEKALYYFQKSFVQYPQRVENIYEVVKYYRETGQNDLAVHYYLMGRKSLDQFSSRDYLFIQKDIYDYKLDFEMTILGYYLNPTNIDLKELSMSILNQKRQIDMNISNNILSNYKFYTDQLISYDTGLWKEHELGKIFCNLGQSFSNEETDGFVSSTPTFCTTNNPNEFFGLVRFVNYTINENGGYEQKDNIETRNAVANMTFDVNTTTWTKQNEQWLQYDRSHDNYYCGLEDVRFHFHKTNNTIYYTANRGLGYGKMVIEHGTINRTTLATQDSRFLQIDNQSSIEKNWTMFTYPEDPNPIYMVYKWHPLTIGKVEGSKLVVKKTIETSHMLQYCRGSIGGIVIGNELWFLCHCVSYEDRRYYYHIMVMLDKKTLEVSRISKMFTFEKEKVEYCSGMDLVGDHTIRMAYSTMDSTTKTLSIPVSWFR